MAAAVGSDTGFDVEGVEDLRIAVNELFALLIEEAEDSTASVELIFTIDATGVEVEGVRRDAEPIAGPEELAQEILEVVVDEHSFDTEDGARRFRLAKAGPGRLMDGPDELGPEEILALFRKYQETGRRSIRNQLIEHHRGLGLAIAADYSGRGVEDDDLRQIALLGILKAVERYDPERGIPFSSFASRTVNGEIKRWFRDRTWTVRPPRSAQERHLEVRQVTERLSHELGRAPTVRELAREIDATEDEVLEAMEAAAAYRAASLDAPRGSSVDGGTRTLGDSLGGGETGFGRMEAKVVIGELLDRMPEREAMILRLRFFDERTQSEIAEEIGISQMHVSRLLRKALLQLRERLGETAAPTDDDDE